VFGAFNITTVELAEQTTLVQNVNIKTPDELGARLGEIFNRVATHMATEKIAPTSPAFSRFFQWEPGVAIVAEAGFAVPAGTRGAADINVSTLPAGKTLKLEMEDVQSQANAAYEALVKHMKDNGLTPNGAPWETYEQNPKDTSKLLVKVYFPIK